MTRYYSEADIGRWYIDHYQEAVRQQQDRIAGAAPEAEIPREHQEPNVKGLLYKLVEETVEAAIAGGCTAKLILAAVGKCIDKEQKRALEHATNGTMPGEEEERKAFIGELVDVEIVLAAAKCVAVHETEPEYGSIEPEELEDTFDQPFNDKMAINLQRIWRVNEFGGLSNAGMKPDIPSDCTCEPKRERLADHDKGCPHHDAIPL